MTDADTLHSDLCELLTLLGMGDHARPQSPHEVFQEALGVLRGRLGSEAAEGAALDALAMILPMAKGYAAAHPVGANQSKCDHADAVISEADRRDSNEISHLTTGVGDGRDCANDQPVA